MNSVLCQCCSNKPFQECCSIVINNQQLPETAQQLMRSRYCAYATNNVDYLLSTWHESTRPDNVKSGELLVIKWNHLLIVDTKLGLKQHNTGSVEFVAYYSSNNTNKQLHEVSQFIKEQNKWFYVDGKMIENSTYRPGRNDACYCGSGKKYKQCCIN